MLIINLARRLKGRLSREQREIVRLKKLPRGTPATTLLISPKIETLDGASLAAQYCQIFQNNAFLFQPDSARPRIIDCGANVGVFTLYFARRFPEARITAFEPDPRVFDVLAKNVARCCARSHIVLEQAAVTDCTDPFVSFCPDHCDAGRIIESFQSEASIQVKAVRLRDYLSERCDLLKLDIEGAEVDVLNDCANCLGMVQRIFVEFHSFIRHPQRLDEMIGVLSRAGFRLFIHTGQAPRRPFLATEEFLGMDCQLDVWGVRD
jgi:FkbM family methyltransferase